MTLPKRMNWCDMLPTPSHSSQRHHEGGLRLSGQLKSGQETPLISYVTVVLNGEKTIKRTLDSVKNQTYENIEHIVLDGASKDATLEILKSHEKNIDYLASEPDAGLYDALNKAIRLCRGDLICILNADDWLLENAAQTAVNALAHTHSSAHLILTAAEVVSNDVHHIWQPAELNMSGYLTCANICHNGVYASRKAYELAGPYDSQYRIAGDFKWLMQCVDSGCESIRIDQATVHYSLGGISSDTKQHSLECVRLLQERFPFLDEHEAWGLFHAFHTFEENKTPFIEKSPENHTQFIRDLLSRHPHEAALVHAIGLAAATMIQHPKESSKETPQETPKVKPTRLQKLKNSINKRVQWLR